MQAGRFDIDALNRELKDKILLTVSRIFKIKKNSFYPAPKVDSSLLSMEILDEPSVKVKDERLLFKIIRKAFSQRRKKIINPLSKTSFLGMDRQAWENVFAKCNIDPANRAEDLFLEDYAKIANQV